jgi:hypothetical protein
MTALAFRPATDTDRRFVIGTFLDSFRSTHTAGLIQMADWNATMGPQAEKLFSRPGAEVIVAYKPGEESPSDAYGWLAHETGHLWPLVTFLYVKEGYRRMGLAWRLLAQIGLDRMSPFRHAAWLERGLAEKVPRARWSPLSVRYPTSIERERAIERARTARRQDEQGRRAERRP